MSEDNESMEFAEMPMMKPKFITIKKTEFRLEVHLRGEFPFSEEFTKEILELYDLSEMYETVIVYISSPGGVSYSAVELKAALEKFDNVITVAAGMIASAGFLIWGIGDLRVIQDHTWMMIHRESYFHGGQTDTHLDLGNYNKEVYSKMLTDCCSFLTDDELERAKRTDVYVTAEDMVERGHAITWDQYVAGDSQLRTMVQMPIFSIGKKLFMKMEDGSIAVLSSINYQGTINELDLFYKTPVEFFENPTIMLEDKDED